MFVFAHRGASGLFPENTLVAFKKAIEMGAKGIELDVQLSKDGVVMVMHDDTLDRTTNGKGRLEKFTLEELKKLDSGFWYSKIYSKEKIPTLEEVIKKLPKNIKLNIEFKPDKKNTAKIAQEVYKIVEKYNYSKQVIVSSFYHQSLLEYRKLDKSIQMGMLFEYDFINIFDYINKSGINPVSINISKDYVDEDLVKEAHSNNLKVAVYTVNENEEVIKLKKIGVDEIFSNYPNILNKK
ncbi:MAG: glycerophosphodiester phosphodiesterase [Fusobacteriaceae bacterium]